MVQPEIKGKENEQNERNGTVQPSVGVHDVEHPVAGSEIPDDSAHPAEYKTLLRSCGNEKGRTLRLKEHGCVDFAGTENAINQRGQRDPAQKCKSRSGEDQDLQDA